MKLTAQKFNINGVPTEAVLSHKDASSLWNINLFEKMTDNWGFDIFAEINGYWASLSEDNQAKIYEIYERIRMVFYGGDTGDSMTRQLMDLVHDLYEFHDLKVVGNYIKFHTNLRVPDTNPPFKERFDELVERANSREKTYLREDYRELVVMTVALRAMVPIWGEFIARTRKETGASYKEYYAFMLLTTSNIMHSEAMERLRIYVQHSVPPEKSLGPAIMGAISSDDFPIWLLGLVLVRRLSIGDVRGEVAGSSLISFIFNYIVHKARSHDGIFIGAVREKNAETDSNDTENKLSKLEGYKAKDETADGDRVIVIHACSDPIDIAKKGCPDLPIELITAAIASTLRGKNVEPTKSQVLLTRIIISRATTQKGALNLTSSNLLQIMGAAAAMLWHRGNHELAALLTANPQDNTNAQQIIGTESRSRINKEQLALLDEYYPYSKRTSGRQKNPKKINVAVENIDLLAQGLSEHTWRLTVPDDWVGRVTGHPKNRDYAVPHNIKVLLADLTIQHCQGKFTPIPIPF